MTRRHSSIAIVLAVAVLFGGAAWGGMALTRELGRVAAIWFSNALLVSALLLSARRLWPYLLGSTYLVNVCIDFLLGDTLGASLALSFANQVEALLAASLLSRSLRTTSDLLNAQVLLRFFGCAVVLAPLVSAALSAVTLHLLRGDSFTESLTQWWAADALGMAIVVPLVLAFRPGELVDTIGKQAALETFGPFALLLLVAVLVFGQVDYPILFLLVPPLVLIAFRFGFAGAAIAISMCAALAILFTLAGFGPLMLMDAPTGSRILILQLLLATLILTTYPVCAVIAGQRRALREVAASEERFRVLAANSHDIIALTDMQGIWRYMSPAVTTVFGWRPEELIGKNGTDFVHPDDAKLYAMGTDALIKGTPVLSGSFRMRHRDGHYIWVETISRVLVDPRGKRTGWVSNSRDISARKRVEQLKNEFISTVSHELRTPLTAMLGAVGLAATGKFGHIEASLQRLLDMAKSNGDRLATLVNDILDFEKVSSGKMQFDMQPRPIAPLIEEAIAAIRPYAAQLNVTVVCSDPLPNATIRIDPSRFQQIMSNLLSNAAKFSHAGGVIEIAAAVVNDRCRISVVDHGCGIPDEFRDSLFERFAQADGSDKRQRGGTGLGMAIAKHFTEQMSGVIRFESQVDVGTTFHLEFPVDHGSDDGGLG